MVLTPLQEPIATWPFTTSHFIKTNPSLSSPKEFYLMKLSQSSFQNRTFVTASLAAILLAGPATAQVESEPLPGDATIVAPGVHHWQETQPDAPLFFNVLTVDLTKRNLGVEVEKSSRGLFSGEKVAKLSEDESTAGHTVIAGVNADFWAMSPRPYNPIGPMVADGMIWYVPAARMERSSLCITRDKKAHIGVMTMALSIDTGNEVIRLQSVNNAGVKDGATLITPPMGNKIALGSPNFIFVPLRLSKAEFLPNLPVLAKVEKHITSPTGPLDADIVLAAFSPDRADNIATLKPGTEVTLLAKVAEVPGVIEEWVGGGPMLVDEGREAVRYNTEGVGKSFIDTRHPRTAVGISRDGTKLYLVTVDGRQPQISIGQSLQELGRYMAKLGCWKATNLDGGGSTSMVVRGEVVNKPSDRTGPRTVTNALLVVNTAPIGPLHSLQILPAEQPLRIPAGTSVKFFAKGFDENSNPVKIPAGSLTWSASPELGEIAPDGNDTNLKASSNPSNGVVTVKASDKIERSAKIAVVSLDEIITDPEVLLLAPGESVPLSIKAVAGPWKVPLLPGMVSTSSADGALSSSIDLVTAVTSGIHTLDLTIGTTTTKLAAYVGSYRAVELASFDNPPAETAPKGDAFDAAKTAFERDASDPREGSAGLGVTYAMTRGGGPSLIVVPVNATVTEPPVKFGLWIYGDGGEAWVRGSAVDTAGKKFIVDFTEGSKGVYWKNEWRRTSANGTTLRADTANPGAKPVYPLVIENLTLSQEQEALKTSGRIILDGLEAVYTPPSTP
jgi:hypothetical protein